MSQLTDQCFTASHLCIVDLEYTHPVTGTDMKMDGRENRKKQVNWFIVMHSCMTDQIQYMVNNIV